MSRQESGRSSTIANMDERPRSIDPIDPYRLYSRDEAAAFLRISVKWLDEMVKRGELYNVRTGKRRLFPRAALTAFVRGERFTPERHLSADDTTTWPVTPSMFQEDE